MLLKYLSQEQVLMFLSALNPSIEECIFDKNGCHVVQKGIERAMAKDLGFLLESMVGSALSMSKDKYSCHVVQKMIECCGD